MVRRTIAIGGGLLVLILLVFGFRGCLDARKERAMEDYVRGANELIKLVEGREPAAVRHPQRAQRHGSDREPREPGERAARGLGDPVRPRSRPRRARTSCPTPTSTSSRRSTSAATRLAEVADQLPGALATEERRNSTGRIAEMMQVFLASDVLLTARYKPKLDRRPERGAGRGGRCRSSNSLRFVEDIEWVNPDFVADQIAGIRGTDGGSATPGLHGNGLGTVSLGGVALTPGGSATVPLTGGHRVRHPGDQPGRQHGDRREGSGDRRPGR